jgi:hypothetical protein
LAADERRLKTNACRPKSASICVHQRPTLCLPFEIAQKLWSKYNA